MGHAIGEQIRKEEEMKNDKETVSELVTVVNLLGLKN